MRRRSAILTTLAAVSTALAGGGPENVLIIADPASPDALRLSNHYIAVRGVPASNVLYMDPDAPSYADFASLNLPVLLAELAARGIEDHIDYILIMPGGGYKLPTGGIVSDVCVGPIQNFSITAAYSSAFVADEILAGGLSRSWPNRYAAGAIDPVAFDSETTYASGQPSESSFARRYFIAFVLGYTGLRGNSPEELLGLVNRSAAADATFPDGTFYLMNNTSDPARNVRSSQYGGAETRIKEAGGAAQILAGALPTGRHDCLGIVSGFANNDPGTTDLTLTPGAFCDHLTSYAAHFDAGQQTKVSAWIKKGASGSFGTVEEPCNQVGKFPRANMHATYRAGLSLGESTFRSVFYYPFQGLPYGDPITRPWSHIPDVSVPELNGATVSGAVTLTPSAITTHPTAGIASFDLLVNGVLADSLTRGSAFSIDTTALPEGYNEFGVVAYEDSPIRTVGNFTGSLDVDNLPHDASMSVNTTSGPFSTRFDFNVSASGAPVSQVLLLQNERVVAASGAAGTLSVHGRLLGASTPTLIAEVQFQDGIRARTQPITLDIANNPGVPDGSTPVAYAYSTPVPPGSIRVVQLPSTFADSFTNASWDVVTGPAQATILGGAGPYRIIQADAGATGSDELSFQVTTPSGTSAVATVNLVYSAGTPCPADLADPIGTLDFSDVIAFLTAFAAMEPPADLADPIGVFDFSDILEFLVVFGSGCP